MSGEYLKRYFPFFVRFRLHVAIFSLHSDSFLSKVACILFVAGCAMKGYV